MKNPVIPLAATANAAVSVSMEIDDDQLGGDGNVRTPGAAHTRSNNSQPIGGPTAGYDPG